MPSPFYEARLVSLVLVCFILIFFLPVLLLPRFQLVLNNFPQEDVAMKLLTKVFQNMFPSINVGTVQLKDIRRVLMLNYDR